MGSCTSKAWGYVYGASGSMVSTLGVHNPLRYRGYIYDEETGLYYLRSRYYSTEFGRFLSADTFVSTGQGILGNNMFAYCRNNPVNRIDISGSADTAIEEEFDDDVEVTPAIPIDGGGGGNGSGGVVGTTGNGGSGPSGFAIKVDSSGIAATPNPNNEPIERHHIVERCQGKKSGFAQTDIQGNSNLIDIPRSLHRKISGYYSSKPRGYSQRVRNELSGTSFMSQWEYGVGIIEKFWKELYEK